MTQKEKQIKINKLITLHANKLNNVPTPPDDAITLLICTHTIDKNHVNISRMYVYVEPRSRFQFFALFGVHGVCNSCCCQSTKVRRYNHCTWCTRPCGKLQPCTIKHIFICVFFLFFCLVLIKTNLNSSMKCNIANTVVVFLL